MQFHGYQNKKGVFDSSSWIGAMLKFTNELSVLSGNAYAFHKK